MPYRPARFTQADNARAKCIEAMAMAAHRKDMETARSPRTWEDEIDGVREFWIGVATASFDALHGIARVNPIEATGEMIVAGIKHRDMSQDGLGATFDIMAAVGDLTEPPEQKGMNQE